MTERRKIGFERAYRQERLIASVTESLLEQLEATGLSRADLAKKLDVSRSDITQALGSGRNLTMRKLPDLAWALDCSVAMSIWPDAFDERLTYFGSLAEAQASGGSMRTGLAA